MFIKDIILVLCLIIISQSCSHRSTDDSHSKSTEISNSTSTENKFPNSIPFLNTFNCSPLSVWIVSFHKAKPCDL